MGGTLIVADSSDRAAWLEARTHFLSASEVAVCLGLTYSARSKLVRAKAGKATEKELAELGEIDDMAQVAAGRHLEEGIFNWFRSETVHTTAHMFGKLIASPVESRLAATPDAILDGSPVELKLTGESALPNWYDSQNIYGWNRLALPWPKPVDTRLRLPRENNRTKPGARDPRTEWRRSREHQLTVLIPALGEPCAPVKYWVQLQVQMHCLGAGDGWLVGAIGGTRRYDFLYERSDAFIEIVLAETKRFWKDVEEQR